MPDDNRVPESAVQLIFGQVSKSINDLSLNVESCSTNIADLINKITLARLTELDEKMTQVERIHNDFSKTLTSINTKVNKFHSWVFLKGPGLIAGIILLFTYGADYFTNKGIFSNNNKTMIHEHEQIVNEMEKENHELRKLIIKMNAKIDGFEKNYNSKSKVESDEETYNRLKKTYGVK